MEKQEIFCLIVGAGMCGVSLGQQLVRTGTLKHEEFCILDRNQDYGGVWEGNKYPGVACDIPSHAYVMRYMLNPNWTNTFAGGSEIQKYYCALADRANLRKCTQFSTLVHEATWNEKTFKWEVLTENTTTKQKKLWLATVLFNNGGNFHRPKLAQIPGREDFKGEQWHSSEWRTDYDLSSKNVAIIGTGPSAAQIGPKIQPIVKKLYLYQRTPGHVFPRGEVMIPAWKKFIFSWFYPILWLYHVSWAVSAARSKDMWLSGTDKNKAMHKKAVAWLETQVSDPVLREKLRPKNEFGCKRPLFLNDWYPMFNQANVELVTEKPIRITEHGIVSKSPQLLDDEDLKDQPVGAYEVRVGKEPAEEVTRDIDVLIWGTGFDMEDWGGRFSVNGINQVNLSQQWGSYPEAYWAIAVHGYPNFFMTLGPNSGNYWANATTVIQLQIDYHCKMVKHIKTQNQIAPYALHPTAEAQDKHNEILKKERGSPAFLSENCSTYHKSSTGATPMHNHFHIYHTWWKLRKITFNDYDEIWQR
ncbi:hypothetical protein BFJ63_vAg15083 [Fusarium oxysporum f. sp. narcissi]|uniref:Monooxygenase n=3 Tax=Fusarium oxysporum TaxID=5507 RepID=A0A2H3GM19_FUSOX|nr:hypothetical protein AU210_012521 [Fusarium oxysporum f. sp. radicis-cucumerinum]RKK32302.1 hypothetical protein BFJ67_g14809 [Fusarium oxysporum f. sp. cepae]RKK93439.1 hypothetical protein BFJ68_g15553 [Fusarium oxysporum]RKL30027.1 hypothetical protein BFJ70_g10323 [Fusarium oxysporum]RYC82015.1 hypothetical protein BFJ63_vAg15083 [Fusarium oxysporum f. sp. narcissi]